MARPVRNHGEGGSALQQHMTPVFAIPVNTIRAPGRPLKKASASAKEALDKSLLVRLLIRAYKALTVDHSIPREACVLMVYKKAADLDSILKASRFLSVFESHFLCSSYFGEPRPCMSGLCRLEAVPDSQDRWPTLDAYVNDAEEHSSHLEAKRQIHRDNWGLYPRDRLVHQELRLIHVHKAYLDECPADFKQAIIELPLPPLPKHLAFRGGPIQHGGRGKRKRAVSNRGSVGRDGTLRVLRRRK